MSRINKIKIGEDIYDITPQIGTGLQFGTGLTNSNVVYVNVGDAQSNDASLPETGISITPKGFWIDPGKFSEYLKALGFKTE